MISEGDEQWEDQGRNDGAGALLPQSGLPRKALEGTQMVQQLQGGEPGLYSLLQSSICRHVQVALDIALKQGPSVQPRLGLRVMIFLPQLSKF